MNIPFNFASAESATGKADLFSSIGIDWKLLLLQTIAFLILLWFLKKFVYPSLVAMLDKRDQLIEESTKAALDAENNAAEAERKTAELLKDARKQADEMLTSAKTEAANIVDMAEKKSRSRAEQIAADAEAEIQKNVSDARKALRAETLSLVAEATEKVVRGTVDVKSDQKIIAKSIEEARS